jgi:hypothetical protein
MTKSLVMNPGQFKPGGAKPLDLDAVARGERRCLTCGRDCDHAEWCWRGADAPAQWTDEQRVDRAVEELGKAADWDPPAVEPTDLAWLERYRVAS